MAGLLSMPLSGQAPAPAGAALPDAAPSRSARKKFRAEARLAKELTDLAINGLGQAKQLHDQLESVCLSYVNFTELSEAAGRELARLRLG